MVEALIEDDRRVDWQPAMRGLLDFAARLTREPASVRPPHLDALRELGLDDRAIHDAAQVIAYFNYINRVADGLGIDLEPDMPPDPRFAVD
jgi:uncharacterized peroxidase-related enzyme